MKEMKLSEDKASRKELRKFLMGTAKSDNRERTVAVQIRVTEKEKRHITLLAKSVGLSVSEMIRQLTNGNKLRCIPPEEYYSVRAELREIRNWMNNAYLGNERLDKYLDRLDRCTETFKEIAKRFYGDSCEEIIANYPAYEEEGYDDGDY